jgi:hypothetical protein
LAWLRPRSRIALGVGRSRPPWNRHTRLFRPLPRVPDNQQDEYDLQSAEKDEIRPPLADDRKDNGDGIDRTQNDICPPIHFRPQDQGEEDHHARNRHVDRDRHEERLIHLEAAQLSGHDVLDGLRAIQREDVPIGEEEHRRRPQCCKLQLHRHVQVFQNSRSARDRTHSCSPPSSERCSTRRVLVEGMPVSPHGRRGRKV